MSYVDVDFAIITDEYRFEVFCDSYSWDIKLECEEPSGAWREVIAGQETACSSHTFVFFCEHSPYQCIDNWMAKRHKLDIFSIGTTV